LAWNYPVHWNEIFRTTIRASIIVSFATFLETYLDRLCSHVELIAKSGLNTHQRGDGTLKRSRKYLTAAGKFSRPSLDAWNGIALFFKVRHVIVHANGFVIGSKHRNAIEQFCQKRADLRLQHGFLEIEPSFLEFLIDRLQDFIRQLETEFRALCEETRQMES